MKLLLKILLFVLVALINNVKVMSATITITNIQEATISLSFHTKIVTKSVFKISENDLVFSCKNEQDLVNYRNWATNVRAVAVKTGGNWVYGAFKTEAKWAGQMSKRGWTAEQITEAVAKGKSYSVVNMVNKANSATRYVHPTTGKSVVIDDVTKELLHIGGTGFKY